MPALAFPFLGFALGLALAWGARSPLDGRPGRATDLAAAGLLGALLLGPGAGWLTLGYADWAFGYRFVATPTVLALLSVVGACVSAPAGLAVGGRISLGSWRRRLPLLGALAVALGALVAVAPHLSPLRMGTTAQVRGGFQTSSLFTSDLGVSLVWVFAFAGLGTWVVLRTDDREEGGHAPPPPPRGSSRPRVRAGGGRA